MSFFDAVVPQIRCKIAQGLRIRLHLRYNKGERKMSLGQNILFASGGKKLSACVIYRANLKRCNKK